MTTGHELQVLTTGRLSGLHPSEQVFVRVARGSGLSVHRCGCGTLLVGLDAPQVERMYADHLGAVAEVAL